jgi:hypothetical protein
MIIALDVVVAAAGASLSGCDARASCAAGSAMRVARTRIRPLRVLRAYILVENSRQLRQNMHYLSRVVARVLSVLLLVGLVTAVYAIIGMAIFGSMERCPLSTPVCPGT